MKKKKALSIAMLIAGILPFLLVVLKGLDGAINGFSFLWGLPEFGIDAFVSIIAIFSYLYWPAYVVGLFLIIAALVALIPAKK